MKYLLVLLIMSICLIGCATNATEDYQKICTTFVRPGDTLYVNESGNIYIQNKKKRQTHYILKQSNGNYRIIFTVGQNGIKIEKAIMVYPNKED